MCIQIGDIHITNAFTLLKMTTKVEQIKKDQREKSQQIAVTKTALDAYNTRAQLCRLQMIYRFQYVKLRLPTNSH